MTSTLDTSWRLAAACVGMEIDLFFPTTPEAIHPAVVNVCAACEVTDECLDYSIATRQDDGVWGGVRAVDRARIRRRRQADARRNKTT